MKNTKISGPINRYEPFLFMLIISMIGMTIVFLTLLFMYVSHSFSKTWQYFMIPKAFWISSLAIIGSSIALHKAYTALKEEEFTKYKTLLGISLALGFTFLLFQLLGWGSMFYKHIYIHQHLTAAYLYVISGLHFLHVIAGLIALLFIFYKSLKLKGYIDNFVYNINPPNILYLQLVMYYWHFTGILWLFLFLFFLIYHF